MKRQKNKGDEMISQDTLFPLSPPSPEAPLQLAVGDQWHNYRRYCKGLEMKVALRDLRTGKIAAVVYGGKAMAKCIADCVNKFAASTMAEHLDRRPQEADLQRRELRGLKK